MKIFQSKRLPIPTTLTNQLFSFIYALSWSIYTHVYNFMFWFYCFVVVQSLTSCLTLCDPMNHSTPGFPVLHHLLELAQTHVHWVGDAIQLSHPLSPSSPFAFNLSSIRVFPSESAFHIMWPKYWSFSFSIIPSTEIPGLISFRMDWLHLLAVQGTLKSLLQHTIQKHRFFKAQPSLWSNSHIHTWLLEKP